MARHQDDSGVLNWLDRAIAVLAPGWAMRRAEARLVTRSYDAIDQHRTRPLFRKAAKGPVQENRETRMALLAQARHLDRSNGYLCGLFNSLVDNVVGDGIRLEAKFRRGKGLATRRNEQAEQAWQEWAREVDTSGVLSLTDVQRMVERELWVAGEVLVVRSLVRDRGPVPLALDVVESERLADLDETKSNGTRIVQGVEFDRRGQIQAYHIYRVNPHDGEFLTTRDSDIERVPADRVIHLFHPKRPGEVRGLTRTAPVANAMQALNQYLDFELTKARIASAFAVMVKRGRGRSGFTLPSTGDASDAADDFSNEIGQIVGGMILPGGPNDSIEAVGSSIQSTAFEAFVTLILRMVAAGLNVSYEILARDFSKHNFSSIRQSLLEDRRHWQCRRRYLNERLNSRVWRWFADDAALAGVAPFNVTGGVDLTQIRWVSPGHEWIDPLKDIQAAVLAMQNGLQSPASVAVAHGQDLEANLEELARLKEASSEAGVSLPFLGSTGAPSNGEAQEAPAPDAESGDGGEESGDDADSEPERALRAV